MKKSTTAAATAILAGAAVGLMLAGGAPFAAEPSAAGGSDTMGGMKHDEMKHAMHDAALHDRIANAKTPHDHAMLADEFEAEAKQLEKKAAEHESMAKSYAAFPGKASGQSMGIHCRTLAKDFRDAAAQNRELAKFHREQGQKQD